MERMTFGLKAMLPMLAVVLLLGACESTGGKSKAAVPSQYSGIALPQGYDVIESETLITGEGERWTGRLVYEVYTSSDEMFEFVRRQMPQLGWTEVSVVRAKNSVLTYSSAGTGRFATIEIIPDMILWGSTVRVNMAPIGGAQRSEVMQPAPVAQPRGGVSTRPLR